MLNYHVRDVESQEDELGKTVGFSSSDFPKVKNTSSKVALDTWTSSTSKAALS